jgi:hypothetical protein
MTGMIEAMTMAERLGDVDLESRAESTPKALSDRRASDEQATGNRRPCVAGALRAKKLRSAKTNGRSKFVAGGDQQSPWARRHRDLFALYVEDKGGEMMLSALEVSLCERLATLTVETERFEARLSAGEHVDLDMLGRLIGHARRVAESLGLKRKARDAITLDDVIHSINVKNQGHEQTNDASNCTE